jgi:hypothetical protein
VVSEDAKDVVSEVAEVPELDDSPSALVLESEVKETVSELDCELVEGSAVGSVLVVTSVETSDVSLVSVLDAVLDTVILSEIEVASSAGSDVDVELAVSGEESASVVVSDVGVSVVDSVSKVVSFTEVDVWLSDEIKLWIEVMLEVDSSSVMATLLASLCAVDIPDDVSTGYVGVMDSIVEWEDEGETVSCDVSEELVSAVVVVSTVPDPDSSEVDVLSLIEVLSSPEELIDSICVVDEVKDDVSLSDVDVTSRAEVASLPERDVVSLSESVVRPVSVGESLSVEVSAVSICVASRVLEVASAVAVESPLRVSVVESELLLVEDSSSDEDTRGASLVVPMSSVVLTTVEISEVRSTVELELETVVEVPSVELSSCVRVPEPEPVSELVAPSPDVENSSELELGSRVEDSSVSETGELVLGPELDVSFVAEMASEKLVSEVESEDKVSELEVFSVKRLLTMLEVSETELVSVAVIDAVARSSLVESSSVDESLLVLASVVVLDSASVLVSELDRISVDEISSRVDIVVASELEIASDDVLEVSPMDVVVKNTSVVSLDTVMSSVAVVTS